VQGHEHDDVRESDHCGRRPFTRPLFPAARSPVFSAHSQDPAGLSPARRAGAPDDPDTAP